MDVAPCVSEHSQNGRTDESEVKKPGDVEAIPRLDIKTPICWMDGSAYSINLSSGTGTMALSHEIGPYDDLVPFQVSLKERVKDGCRSCFSLDTLKKLFPIIVWLPDYNFLKLAFDLVAGITVGVTIIPQALAFAGIAGLAPQYGLYSGIICCFVYVLMGSAKDITLGPSAITSLLTAAFATSLSPKLPNGDTDPTMAIMLTLTTGLIHIFMGVCQLGIMVSFISFPVINAFSSAAAVTIAVSQLGLLTSRTMATSSDDVPECLKDHTYTISTLWADINNIGIHSIFNLCLEMQEKGMHS
ncbi:sodium-independent sulfate anion transporter [Biomphalaria pfeifferi]|uniref:Sodium-independent sulfate anion transporter n=1 Tax=Biomphalaria pfeifferi TaxID=112525 RepID=A0AAD8BP04_BIOPF|nr:sodium-independent sulfate anion transporter [Biomphalaria pfeifferi]